MGTPSWQHAALAGLLLASTTQSSCRAQGGAPLPAGVSAVWDVGKAHREATPTRERVCVNGLWRWQPADPKADQVPPGDWGYFKVPGCWPGITDYLQKDCQTVFADPTWQSTNLGEVTAAWYQREIAIPDLQEARKSIADRLEEIARSDVSRLMKVKQMLLEREEAA